MPRMCVYLYDDIFFEISINAVCGCLYFDNQIVEEE